MEVCKSGCWYSNKLDSTDMTWVNDDILLVWAYEQTSLEYKSK